MSKFWNHLNQSTLLSDLQEQLLNIVDEAKATEFTLLGRFGETPETLNSLEELTEIAQQASDFYSQLARLSLRVAEAQPSITPDMLRLVLDKTKTIQNRIPALERSTQEIKLDWRLG